MALDSAPGQNHRAIASLDGLRALSVGMVVGLHTLQRLSLTHHVPWGLYVFANGDMGVQIFFVISGFLITTLLLRERERTGRIRLGAFYIRRAFRILPPLYAYILVVAVLAHLRRMPGVNGRNLLLAFTLTQNYIHWPSVWAFEHFWSLCIEEQFYLLWPGLLALCIMRRPSGWRATHGRGIAAGIALAAAFAEPLLRIAYSRYFPAPHYYRVFHLASDGIMFGAAGALLQGSRRFETAYRSLTRWPWALPILLVILSALDIRFENYFNLTLGATLQSIVILVWLLWLTRNPGTPQGRILNQPALAWVGRLSYSIYLWQTLFLHHSNVTVFGPHTLFSTFPGSWAAILAVAVFSYYAIEQPSLRLRDLVMKNLRRRAA